MTDNKNSYFDNEFGCKEKCKKIFLIVIVVLKLIVINANQAII